MMGTKDTDIRAVWNTDDGEFRVVYQEEFDRLLMFAEQQCMIIEPNDTPAPDAYTVKAQNTGDGRPWQRSVGDVGAAVSLAKRVLRQPQSLAQRQRDLRTWAAQLPEA